MRILIIEDELRIANRIERMAKRNFGSIIKSIHKEEYLANAKQYIENNPELDLVFLDLNLNGENGFDVLEEMVANKFQTIIISAYKEKALKAFEYGVLDFIAKPFDEPRFIKGIERFQNIDKSLHNIKYLTVKKRDKYQLFSISDIDYIQGAGNYSELVFADGTRELHSKTLDSLLLILPDFYYRVHKSYIISLRKIKTIHSEPGSKYYLKLYSGTEIPIGRTKYKELKLKLIH